MSAKKQLILVESPTKAKTLSRFLGQKYKIEATFGHIRDLGKGTLSVDVENEYQPKYVIPREKSKRVKELRALVSEGDRVILATDPDREGEAIAYHMAVILSQSGAKVTSEKIDENKFDRITFHEITEEAIQEALDHPGKINFELVDAQQARRVLDRLVGYELSPMLWKKLSRRWLSAGRVQSVSVRLIVEREREIEKFNKEEFWTIEGVFESDKKEKLSAGLFSYEGTPFETTQKITLFDGEYSFSKTSISSSERAQEIITHLQAPFIVKAVEKREIKRNPAPPYTTSALQIDAGRRLGYTAKRIMQLAQQLYEEGVITYHRTDSVNLSDKFLKAAFAFIAEKYGKEYATTRTFKTKSQLAQEAHEAIRPTDINLNPEKFAQNAKFDKPHHNLYELIWKRAVASQAAAAVFDSTTIEVVSQNNYVFKTQGSIVTFEGFLKISGRDSETVYLPAVTVGETVKFKEAIPTQKFTSPPPRYSEASLIKSLEEDGIGRPSTYAPTITTIQDRLYVEKETKEDGRKGRNFVPTELGFLVTDFLVAHFTSIVELPFTAKMEEELDEIAEGKRRWVSVIDDFYKPFKQKLLHVEETVEKAEIPQEKTGEKCPECKVGDVVIKQGRYGKFLACSRFPDCKYTKNVVEKLDVACPTCSIGEVVVKKTKKGRIFYGCSRYPDCTYASWTKPEVKSEK